MKKKLPEKQNKRTFANLWDITKPKEFSASMFLLGRERWLIIDIISFQTGSELFLFNRLIARLFLLCALDSACYLFWFRNIEEMYLALDWPFGAEGRLFIVLIG